MPTLNVNHGWAGTVDIDLNGEGHVDKNVETAFTCGHCHSFALAVHERFGWPIMGVRWMDEDPFPHPTKGLLPGRPIPDHVVILHPTEGLVDVEGRYRDHEDDADEVDPDDVRSGFDGWYRESEPDVAALYVDAWAAKLGLAA